ncbi:unnamed protein product [Rotaria magnacalcarata]|uniref:Protein phosphatase 1 regulatory subunit 21 n=2 Tax=Rotaria magnacalcarata TaxID=392030 RepID=A0A816MWJ6_9BILA|nr:unnamed protein product [Rotaria magnacalcarata]CAF1577777.1 unnamed protein product [Rotaria magnacalcarata]CAF1994490.1 unnamed protein product [Rotaria magnacalcarata]CAF2061695.1 unnamed protein product [Rotaria magnacalcarata]CAF2118371.1 unnamed protein product [Rotaria magnacalcarata]
MDLQNKYQILASEFSKVRGQVTVLKKAVIDEQQKNQQLQEDINKKDQNLRRNGQEIETLSFLNTQLKSRLEILQQELNEFDANAKLKKSNSNKTLQVNPFNDNVLALELEQKIKQYETIQRRVYELDKQIADNENERLTYRSNVEHLQNQMTEMQESHQRTRDEFERILKQLKQENELLNVQIKQHLTEQSSVVTVSRKSSILNPPTKNVHESAPLPQPEIFLYKYLNAWRDAFTELTIYIEERLKNNNRSSEHNEKMAQTVKAFQQHADNFLLALKTHLFDGKSSHVDKNTTDFAELFSMFVSSCEKVLGFANKSVCDEPKLISSLENQEKIYGKIHKLNDALNQLFQRWINNLSLLREIAVAIIQFDSSLPTTADQLQAKIVEILTTFQTGAIIHCDLDKNYNDKLCLEYELSSSPVHLTTTDECILAALRKLANQEQQISQLMREHQTYLFEFHHRKKELSQSEENILIDLSDDSCQQLIDVHMKQSLYNAETIGTLEQEKEHWRLEYQLLKIKFEKMRDDHSKQIEELKDKTNQTTATGTNEEFDGIIISSPTTPITNNQRENRTTSDPPSERELMIKQYYSQKILDVETKLQLVNGRGIAFYNELANIHQRLRNSKDQEVKCRIEIEQSQQELANMKDELATTTKGYEEQIATMSEHLASMNEQITSQNDKIDRLQQQLHTNPKDGKKSKK